MPLPDGQFGYTNGNVLARIEGKPTSLGKGYFHHSVANDAELRFGGIPQPSHDHLAKEQVPTPTQSHNQWHHVSGMEKGTDSHGDATRNVEVVKDLKHFATDHGKCREDNASHEDDEHGTTRVDLVMKEEGKEVGWAVGIIWEPKGNVGVEYAVEIGHARRELVVAESSFERQSEEQSEDGVVHGCCERKYEGCACCMSRNGDAGVDEGV